MTDPRTGVRPGDEFVVTVDRSGADGTTTVVAVGELDHLGAPVLLTAVQDVVRSGTGVVLDLSGVTFINAAGLTVVARLIQASEHRGRRLALRSGGRRAVRTPMTITGLLQQVDEVG